MAKRRTRRKVEINDVVHLVLEDQSEDDLDDLVTLEKPQEQENECSGRK